MELQLQPLNLPSDQERAFIIAGPCSAETEEQVMTTAKQLAGKGCHLFRAGIWKPRTKPGGFEGHGEPALPWLANVKKETGMLVATEVATQSFCCSGAGRCAQGNRRNSIGKEPRQS